jgi:LuxR family quorum sensing-dependent transcriptional regulator
MHDFSRTIDDFGFDRFLMSRLPSPGEKIDPYIIHHTWPAFWAARYLSENYVQHDLIPLALVRQARPFTWNEARSRYQRSRIDFQIDLEVQEIGMRDGFAVALGTVEGIQAAASLASKDEVCLSASHRKLLHMVCLQAQIRAVELKERHRDAFPILSPREREVLSWLAGGKSLVETADRLNISLTTAKTHTKRARSKFNVENTTQAVVAAIRSRQVKP